MRLLLGVMSIAAVRLASAANECPDGTANSECPLWPLKPLSIETSRGTWMALDVSPDGNAVVFDLLGKIFSLPIAGGRAKQLTRGSAFDELPHFSRDGKFVLFSSDRGPQIQLWRVPREGGEPTPAPPEERVGIPLALDINGTNSDPVTWSSSGALAQGAGDLHATAEATTIWSPDGQYGVRSERLGSARLYDTSECQRLRGARLLLVERSTGATRPLASAGSDCRKGASMPASAFIPDGSAFITSHSGQIWRIDIPSGKSESIPFSAEVQLQVRPRETFSHRISDEPRVHARLIEHARLSPDRKQVVFGAFDRIWIRPLPKGTPRRLTQLVVGEFQPVWSPDGRFVAFISWDDKTNSGAIWRIRLDAGCLQRAACHLERVTAGTGRYMHLAYSPDGARIVAMKTEVGARVGTFSAKPFWVAATGGPITYFGKKRNVNAEFSDLYFLPDDSDRVMEVGTSNYLSEAPGRHYAPQCVVVRHRLAETPVDSDDEPILTIRDAPRAESPWQDRSPGYMLPCGGLVSPDGKQVLFRRNNGELFRISLPNRIGSDAQTLDLVPAEAEVISAPGLGGDSPAWSADGRLITFTFGHTLYIRARTARTEGHPPAAALEAIPIDVAIPRNLSTDVVVFRNARIITMRGNEVVEKGDLVVRGRRIAAVGQTGTVTVPVGARVVDASDLTLMPGLLDLHNHGFTNTFEAHVHDSRNRILETNLAFGVLNSRDPQSYVTDILTTEDLIEAGRMLAPRVRTTFVGIGYSSAVHLSTFGRAKEIVHRYGQSGLNVGYLKEYVSGPRRQRQFLAMAAASEGLNVTSHGVDLRHLITNAIDGYGGFDHPVVSVPLYDDVLQLLADTGIAWADNNWRWALADYFVPKLSSEERQKLQRLYKPREYGTLKGTLDSLLPATARDMRPDVETAADPQAAVTMAKSLAAAIKKGVRIVNGSHGDDTPGLGTHLQLWAYVEGGATPLEALRTSTLWSAEALDWGSDLGSLEVGKIADLVILDRNPLDRIQNSIAIRQVMFSGRLYDAETLVEVQLPSPTRTGPQTRQHH
jgi:imidazolonepropionase-like amidohydrolase/WD40 repeat protein